MSELKPRPHAEIIKAWADGKAVQGRRQTNHVWVDVISEYPAFFSNWEYRIKPEPVKVQSRRWLARLANGVYVLALATNADQVTFYEKTPGFVKWIDTEWQYVEVEVEN